VSRKGSEVLKDPNPQSKIRNQKFFDAHCDTVMRVFDGGLDFVAGQGRAHIDLPRLLTAGYSVQLFAIFAPKSQYPDRDLRAFADDVIAVIMGWVEASSERMRLITEASHIRDLCASEGVVGALLGMEGADPLEGKAENLAHFHQAGLRSLIPAWSDNAFSGTCMGSGGPLTGEGAKLIELAEALRVMIDVSHLSDAAFDQGRQMTRRPFVASHSNCREICPSPRNLTDEQIRALAARGGVMGVNLSADFLAPDYMVLWDAIAGPSYAVARQTADPAEKRRIRDEARARLVQIPLPPTEWITRHVRHAIDVGGEDCIGLGGDLDGITTMPVGITGAESYPTIADLLSVGGLTAAQVEKVCWRNMARVYGEVLG
jgi:membrane dipeptidase